MRHLISIFAAIILLVSTHTGFGQSPTTAPSQAVAPLRVGVIGLVHGHAHGLFQQLRHHPEIQIVGIAEPDQQLAAYYAKSYKLDANLLFTSPAQMLAEAKPQAVVLYTDTFDHRAMVELCAANGIPVMMEKPLAVSLEDGLAIQKAAQSAKIPVLVNYETTWYPSNHAAYDLTRDGSIGSIRKIVVHDGHQGPIEIGVGPEFSKWLTDPKLDGGGALFDFGCYGADLASWLLDNQRPLSVTAVTQQIKPDIYPKVDDEATIILTYPKAQVIIQASWNWPYSRKDMEVYGTNGYAITLAADHLRVLRPHKHEEQVTAPPLAVPFNNSLSMLKAVVLDGAKPDGLSSLETNLLVTEILDAARRSAETGKTVQLPTTRPS